MVVHPDNEVHLPRYSLTNRLPDETLLAIFRYALPSSWVVKYGRTMPPFPPAGWSADLCTKLSIIRVCKEWYRIGLEFLYESVTLHWIGQLPAFVQALETLADGGVGAFVQYLQVEYWVPRGYHKLHNTELKKIFKLCPRLTHLAFNPQVLPLGPIPAFPEVSTLTLGSIAHLEICDRVKHAMVVPALVQLCSTLQSLSILLPTTHDTDHPTLVFASLENLRLGVAAESVFPGSGPIWVIPHLKQLLIHRACTCEIAGTTSPSSDMFSTVVRVLLDRYGCTLRVLDVRLDWDSVKVQSERDFALWLDPCPVLQHFYVPVLLSGPRYFDEPVFRTVDILDENDPRSLPTFAHSRAWLKDRYPELRTCHGGDSCLDLFPQLPPIGAGSNGLSSFSAASCLQFLCSEEFERYIYDDGPYLNPELDHNGEDHGTEYSNEHVSDEESDSSDFNDFDDIDDTVPIAGDDDDWEFASDVPIYSTPTYNFSTDSYLQFLCSEAYESPDYDIYALNPNADVEVDHNVEDHGTETCNEHVSGEESDCNDFNDFDDIDDTLPIAGDDDNWETYIYTT
ncbi:F-box domain-containing protein [Mycena sanguinolenta]|uniref:F-box domain-containing protein n=1 Tax=Mycena sanguinolenta TaxID=230812 RepID=A0A8H6XLI3_9AGAR|nr:F-box domain-containing protein [Mycena sanguinolenta]